MKKFCAATRLAPGSLVLCLSVSLALATTACSGKAGDGEPGGGSGGAGGDGEPDPGRPPPGALSQHALERNPAKPLHCDDPLAVTPGPSPLVRLTNTEYRNTVKDLFKMVGLSTAVPETNLPLEQVVEGFANNASGQSPSVDLVEAVEGGGRKAAGVISANLAALKKFSGCAENQEDEACTDKVLARFGELAFRRPLSDDEKLRWQGFLKNVRSTHGFNAGLESLLSTMLQAPQFLYRPEVGANVVKGGAVKLSSFEVASRLSYLLWDTMPDAELFDAARAEELDDVDGLQKQVERMLKDPRAKSTVADFHRQWLDLDRLRSNGSTKDEATYKTWTRATADASFSGLEQWLADIYWRSENNTLSTLLTDRHAYVNASTASVYGISEKLGADLVMRPLDDKRAGLLTQAGMLAGLAHDKVHAPILRGVFVLEKLLCSPPPPPPQNTDLSVSQPKAGENMSTRERIIKNVESQQRCTSCHKLIDAAGFAMENFDAIGGYRTKEESFDIDSSAALSGTYDADGQFLGVVPMAEKLSQSEQVAQCLVTHWFRYATARSDEEADGCNIARVTDAFLAANGDMKKVLVELTRSDAFRYRSPIDK